MIEYGVVLMAALVAAGLTLFSGFGLGTLLMPAFAFFFPLETAIAATAIVHLANNVFKIVLVGKHTDKGVLLRFAAPAAAAAIPGALLLGAASMIPALAQYEVRLAGVTIDAEVSVLKVVLAGVIAGFAVLELHPKFEGLNFAPRWLPLGGVVSGFFGGLSGHQGALRMAFLTRTGLSKEQLIATGVASAVLVDVIRLVVYGAERVTLPPEGAGRIPTGLVALACVAAFAGSYGASLLIPKVTLRGVRVCVGVMLLVVAALMGAGWI